MSEKPLPSFRELLGMVLLGFIPAAIGVVLVLWGLIALAGWLFLGGPPGQLG